MIKLCKKYPIFKGFNHRTNSSIIELFTKISGFFALCPENALKIKFFMSLILLDILHAQGIFRAYILYLYKKLYIYKYSIYYIYNRIVKKVFFLKKRAVLP